ncbi:hypothetical protein Stok01_01711 [Sulfurisphaera tokodaii]
MKVKNIVFVILEILGVGMIYLGFKTRGVESIVLGIGGLLFMIVIGLYFTRDTSVQSRQN